MTHHPRVPHHYHMSSTPVLRAHFQESIGEYSIDYYTVVSQLLKLNMASLKCLCSEISFGVDFWLLYYAAIGLFLSALQCSGQSASTENNSLSPQPWAITLLGRTRCPRIQLEPHPRVCTNLNTMLDFFPSKLQISGTLNPPGRKGSRPCI